MARKVLNVTTASGSSAILSVSNTKTSTYQTSQTNNNWNIGAGFQWTFNKTRSDSYTLAKMSWQGGDGVHSYFCFWPSVEMPISTCLTPPERESNKIRFSKHFQMIRSLLYLSLFVESVVFLACFRNSLPTENGDHIF